MLLQKKTNDFEEKTTVVEDEDSEMTTFACEDENSCMSSK